MVTQDEEKDKDDWGPYSRVFGDRGSGWEGASVIGCRLSGTDKELMAR
jgi:hypothetical protein